MAIRTDYAANDKYLATEHNEENTKILENEGNILALKEFDFDAGETIDGSPIPKAVCFVEGTDEGEIRSQTVEGTYDSVNNTTWRGALFAIPSDINHITTIKVKYRNTGGLTGTLRWELRQDSETGTVIGTVDVDISTISTSFTEYTLTFNENVDPSSNVVLIAKGISIAGGYMQWRTNTSGGTRKWSNDSGGSWGTDSFAHYMIASGKFNAPDGVSLTDSGDSAKLGFVGFVYSDEDALDPTKVQFTGILGGFSGLTPKKPVFLNGSAGQISNTPGTHSVPIGFAITATEIVIQEGKIGAGYQGKETVAGGTTAYTVPSSCSIAIIALENSDDNSRFAKGDLMLIRGIKTTATLQSTYDGTFNKPTTTITWSGDTLTFSGDTSYMNGTIYKFKHL